MTKVLRVLLLFCPFIATAQTDYAPLENKGPIPAAFQEFRNVASFQRDTRDSLKSRADNKLFESFQLRSNYSIYKLLNGGFIIYSGPIYDYVNRVADNLLKHDPALRKSIHVYVTHSSSVNAFAFNNGFIFINLGLITHLENEAQLAYILSHEISHYLKKHSFQRYKKVKEVVRKNKSALEKQYGIYNEDDLEMFVNHYSREQEADADKTGYLLFEQSPYERKQAVLALDELNYASLPFSNDPISKTFFQSTCLTIPPTYFPDTATSIQVDEFENDTAYNHPSTGKRKAEILAMADTARSTGAAFVQSPEAFYAVRNNCRYELSRLYLLERDYIGSLYNTAILLKSDPQSVYLNTCLVKALYYIQKSVNLSGGVSQISRNPKKVKGETQKLHYFLKKLSREELNAICLQKAWEVTFAFPNNTEIDVFTKGITQNFIAVVSNKISYFKAESQYNDSLLASSYQSDTAGVDKKLYVGNKTQRKRKVVKHSFAPFAMCRYVKNETFLDVFDSLAAITQPVETTDGDESDDDASPTAKKKKNKKNNLVATANKKGRQPTFKNMILLDISHFHIDTRREEYMRYVNGNNKKDDVIEVIRTCAGKNDIALTHLNAEDLKQQDSTAFNDRALLESWLYERENNKLLDEKLNIDYERVNRLSQKYNSRYVCFVNSAGFIFAKDPSQIFLNLIVSVLYPPLLPVAAYTIFVPKTAYLLEFTVYDIQTGKKAYYVNNLYDSGDRIDIIKAEVYNIFFQLKHREN